MSPPAPSASAKRPEAASALPGGVPGDDGPAGPQLAVFDHPAILASLGNVDKDGKIEVSLLLGGLRCSGCAAKVERTLASSTGVDSVEVNFANHRARLRFDPSLTALSTIIGGVQAVGYQAQPYDRGRSEQALETERRDRLRRIGVAALFGAQIMMISVALYAGDWWGMAPGTKQLLEGAAVLLCLPVIGFCAAPFFNGAWRDLRNGRAGMDVPVSLGISLAFAGSVHALWTGQGAVYFDSVAMFVTFLLAARHVEFSVRRANANGLEALTTAMPAMAWRVSPGATGQESSLEQLPVSMLEVGDLVQIRPGEMVPADGDLTDGESPVSEALLTGEQHPVTRRVGDRLMAGTLLVAGPVTMRVTAVGTDTISGQIRSLVERTLATRSPVAALADRVAGWFIFAVLLLASAVALWCAFEAPDRILPTVIAVLVVTCPCALSLATPVALTAATVAAGKQKVLVLKAGALEVLARTNSWVFDKTGTLTTGVSTLRVVDTLTNSSPNRSPSRSPSLPAGLSTGAATNLARALERDMSHPVARALRSATPAPDAAFFDAVASSVQSHPSKGVEGTVSGRRYYLGKLEYVLEASGNILEPDEHAAFAMLPDTAVFLADDNGVLTRFGLVGQIRPEAHEALDGLRQLGLKVSMLSGDRAEPVEQIAQHLGLSEYEAGLDPFQKRDRVKRLKASGATVAMVGDGINDSPVLAESDISIAMGEGAPLSLMTSDLVLLDGDLRKLPLVVDIARRCSRIIKQNLLWAAGYNLVALPLAVAGVLPPWAAAIGMSASSIVVVLNGARAGRMPRSAQAQLDTPVPGGPDSGTLDITAAQPGAQP